MEVVSLMEQIGEVIERRALVGAEEEEEVMIIKVTVVVTEVLGTKKIKIPNVVEESYMMILL
jgi:hypothetical protein